MPVVPWLETRLRVAYPFPHRVEKRLGCEKGKTLSGVHIAIQNQNAHENGNFFRNFPELAKTPNHLCAARWALSSFARPLPYADAYGKGCVALRAGLTFFCSSKWDHFYHLTGR